MAHGGSWKTKRIGAGFLQTPMMCFSLLFICFWVSFLCFLRLSSILSFVVHWFSLFFLVGLSLVVDLFFVVFIVFLRFYFFFKKMNSCWFVGFWLSLFLFIGFLWCFCCFSLVFMFFCWFSVVFGGILNSKMKICKTGQHYKFQCVATWNHSIAIQSAYFRVKKMHAKFSQSCVFFSIGVPKSNEKKKPYLKHICNQKCSSLHIYRVLWTLCLKDALRLFFFLQTCLLFLSPLKMENSKKQGPKVPAKK